MFSERLEKLIQASLQDGILTDQEKAAIIKRAEAEGEDIDEVEIYIDSLLQKRQKELNNSDVKREANTKQSYSMQILSKRLNAISLTYDEVEEIENTLPEEKAAKRSDFLASKQINMIETFPVPNTKEDIIDFLSTSISLANKEIGFLDKKKNYFIVVLLAGIILPVVGWMAGLQLMRRKSFSEEKLKQAWRAKSEQVLIKGRSLRGDSEFTQQLDYYENLLRK